LANSNIEGRTYINGTHGRSSGAVNGAVATHIASSPCQPVWRYVMFNKIKDDRFDSWDFEPMGFTASELMKMKLAAPKWAIPGILPEGINILAGKPKMGKSVLSLNVALAIASGGKVLGRIDVEKGSVLYLALEDSKIRLKTRLTAMLQGSKAPDNLHLEIAWPNMENDGLIALDKKLETIPDVRLLIIDTLKKIRPLKRGRNINPYDFDYEIISAVKEIADKHNIAVLLIHHLRKTESEDSFDDFSGTGAADSLLAFKRKTGQADAELHVVGRDIDAAEYALKYHSDIWTWELIGNADEIKSTKNIQTIYDTIKEESPISAKNICKITGIKYPSVRYGLKTLLNDKNIKYGEKYGTYEIQKSI